MGDIAATLLTVEELQRVKELRKKDPTASSKLYRRLKQRHSKKNKKVDQPNRNHHQKFQWRPTSREETTANTVLLQTSSEDEENQYEDSEEYASDFDATLATLEAESSASPEVLSEIRDLFERFTLLDATRAAGKGGGGGEEFMEFSEGGRPTAADDRKKKKEAFDDDEDEEDMEQGSSTGLSKKKLKQMRRPIVAFLKQICPRPEVVESWDTTAPDPSTLVHLKAHRNTVVVPGHWSHKRRYLQGKRGLERTQFALPTYIQATRISEIRSAIEAKDAKKTLKQRMREKVRPRHRKMNIDYQTLHDAFFKYATKPGFTKFGDVYFEGKETEMHFRKYVPGKLSERCRDALGMTSALDAPPWLLNMQRYGPPPSYPNLVVPGVNAHIPEGAALGFQPGGWGKPPSLDQLKIWGVTPRFEEVVLGEDDLEGLEGGGEMAYWGALQTLESDEEREEQEGPLGEDLDETTSTVMEDESALGTTTPLLTGGVATPVVLDPTGLSTVSLISGIQSTGGAAFGLETPQSVDLRRTGFLTDELSKPYSVLEKTKAPSQPGALFSSDTVYILPNTSNTNSDNTE